MTNVEGRWHVISELQTTGASSVTIASILGQAEGTGRATYRASQHLTYTVTWTEADGYQVTLTDTSPADWTIAYRKPRANRFQRAGDWAGTWRQASKQAGLLAETYPQLQVWVVPTRAYEDAHPGQKDNGNCLVNSGRRVRITEDGTVAGPDGETVRTLAAPATRQGHPRHQLRQFTVTARRDNGRTERIRVQAQTERDAILRAGINLGTSDPAAWIVTGVHDPAPATWTPGEATP